jgi:hypothetical protein
MRKFKGPVRFGTEKIIGFPRLAAIFKGAPSSDSSVIGEAGSGALPRFFGLEQC